MTEEEDEEREESIPEYSPINRNRNKRSTKKLKTATGARPTSRGKAPATPRINANNASTTRTLEEVQDLINMEVSLPSSTLTTPTTATKKSAASNGEGTIFQDRKGGKKRYYTPGLVVTNNTITPYNKNRIEKPLREKIWPWYKFFPESSEMTMEPVVMKKIFKNMDPPFQGSSQEKHQYISDHTNVSAAMFNAMKNYIISRLKDTVQAYWNHNKQTMPDLDLLLACGDRSIVLDFPARQHEQKFKNMNHFRFYWDKLLPNATAPKVDSWDIEVRYYNTLSPKNKGITPADEAFLCLCIKNYWQRWEKMFQLKRLHPECQVVTKASKPQQLLESAGTTPNPVAEDPEFHVDQLEKKVYLWGKYRGKYTISNSGSNRSGGWSAEGKEEYMRLWMAVKKGRGAEGTLAKEKVILDSLRQFHGIVAANAENHRLRKQRENVKAARAAPAVNLMVTVEDSEEDEDDEVEVQDEEEEEQEVTRQEEDV